ncbi:ribonuclease H family protein [Capnocytophaga leadbetteri]|uniref:ribonuclease H family protein n=1 Tax=Capnocytophaga leadbetteri TaxID=327575 RepID=UPI0028D19F73|nr:ribonuclease H family protein [Capnocytophaga leadbetteri]
MSKKKYYVVWEGHQTGIFSSWDKCKKAVEGYPYAKFKSFESQAMAEKAFSESFELYKGKNTAAPSTLSPLERQRIGNPILPSIAVDAACSGNPGVMEYRGVDTQTQAEIFRLQPMKDGTNNIGEFLAIVHALAFLKQRNLSLPIYSDSKIAMNWVRQKVCKTKVPHTPHNEKIFELIARAERWLHQNTYPNPILKWETQAWGENPADFGRKDT